MCWFFLRFRTYIVHRNRGISDWYYTRIWCSDTDSRSIYLSIPFRWGRIRGVRIWNSRCIKTSMNIMWLYYFVRITTFDIAVIFLSIQLFSNNYQEKMIETIYKDYFIIQNVTRLYCEQWLTCSYNFSFIRISIFFLPYWKSLKLLQAK